jgi:hypothetical protein
VDFNRKRWLRLVKQPRNSSWLKKHVDWLEWLEDYSTLQGYRVIFKTCKKAVYDHNTQTIIIPLKMSPLVQVMCLLHELGHALVGMRVKGERYGLGYSQHGRKARSLMSKVDCMDEEYEAWHRGQKLAERLGIKLPMQQWCIYKARQLKTYARWVGRRWYPVKIN